MVVRRLRVTAAAAVFVSASISIVYTLVSAGTRLETEADWADKQILRTDGQITPGTHIDDDMASPQPPLPPLPRVFPEPGDCVTVLSKESIVDFVQADFAVVHFDVSWSLNHRELSLEYTKALIMLESFYPDIKLGRIDMTDDPTLFGGAGVQNIFELFRNGIIIPRCSFDMFDQDFGTYGIGTDGGSNRDPASLVDWLLSEKAKEPPHRLVEPEDSAVITLSSKDFKGFIEADIAVVHCYHPWSLLDSKFSQEFTKASIELRDVDPAIKLGKIDADAFSSLSGRRFGMYESSVRVFRNGVQASELSGQNHRSIVEFLKGTKAQDEPPRRFVEPEDSAVTVVSADASFEDFVQKDFAVVHFHVPWSDRSNNFSPEYTKASVELQGVDPAIKLGKMDVSVNEINSLHGLASGIRSESVKIFRNGIGGASYEESEERASQLIEFLKAEKAKKPLPLPFVEPEDSAVAVLCDESFDSFTQAELAVVHFYNPRSGLSNELSAEFTKASIKLQGIDAAIKLGKIDMSCEANRPLGLRFGIEEYSSVVVFRNGSMQGFSHHFPRGSADIVNFSTGAKAQEMRGYRVDDFSGMNDFCDFEDFEDNDLDGLGGGLDDDVEGSMDVESFCRSREREDGVSFKPSSCLEGPEDSAVTQVTIDAFEHFIEAEMAAVHFHRPGSGRSDKLSREYTKASIKLQGIDPTIKLGKIDVSGGDDPTVSRALGLQGGCAIRVFRNGIEISARDELESLSSYSDAADIVEFITAEKMKEPLRRFVEPIDSAVRILSADIIKQFIQQNFAVVYFYPPWAGGNNDFSPEYTKASIELQGFDSTIKLGKIAVGYSTFRLLPDKFAPDRGSAIQIFRNGIGGSFFMPHSLDAAGLVAYLKAEKANATIALSEGNFRDFIEAGFAAVLFHIRGSHEIPMEYTKASLELKRVDPAIKLGIYELGELDILGRTSFLKTLQHLEVPTVRVFRNGLEASGFSSSRDAFSDSGFSSEFWDRRETSAASRGPFNAANILKFLEAEKAKEPMRRFVEPEDSAVDNVSTGTIHDFIETEMALVYFYVPWSRPSNDFLPEYTAASIKLRHVDRTIRSASHTFIRLGKIDVGDETNSPLVSTFGVKDFPSLRIFRNGVETSSFRSLPDVTSILTIIEMEKMKPLPHRFVEPEDSAVVALSMETFCSFIHADLAVVHYYAPWSSHCNKFSPEYTKASIELRDVYPAIKLGKIAVPETKGENTFPPIKIFRNGVNTSNYSYVNTASLVDLLKSEEASAVSFLTEGTIDGFVEADFSVVRFSRPWTPCLKSYLAFIKASTELNRIDPTIKMGVMNVNDDKFKSLSKRFGVQSSVIKIFRNGVESGYSGPRGNVAGLVESLINEKANEVFAHGQVFVINRMVQSSITVAVRDRDAGPLSQKVPNNARGTDHGGTIRGV